MVEYLEKCSYFRGAIASKWIAQIRSGPCQISVYSCASESREYEQLISIPLFVHYAKQEC